MEALGFDLRYFLFQATNFVLLFLILRKLLHKPLLSLMEKRSEEISEGLANAERMKVALAETEQKQQELLDAARGEARSMIETTRSEAKKLSEDLKAEAATRAERMLKQAEAELRAERERMFEELRAELAGLVVTAAGKIIESDEASAERTRHARQLVKELSK